MYNEEIKAFYSSFLEKYVSITLMFNIKNKYLELYKLLNELRSYHEEGMIFKFLYDYEHLEEYISKSNHLYLKEINKRDGYLLDDVNGKNLDDEQRMIVYSDEDYQLINAGAGSGKTLTIVAKVKYLILKNLVTSDNILCLSFTRKSSCELEDKLFMATNKKIDTYTFHKIALIILEKANILISLADGDYLDYVIHEYFVSYLAFDKLLMKCVVTITNVYSDPLQDKSFFLLEKELCRFIKIMKCNYSDYSILKQCFKHVSCILRQSKRKKESSFLVLATSFLDFYQQELLSSKMFDIDDVISLATKVLLDKKIILPYKYLFIDEYQDTSLLRLSFIKALLANTNAKLVVVGDDFQSIYRFTGCNLYTFIYFKKYFPFAKMFFLEKTYRNSQELIDIAGNFIMQNKSQIPKKLVSSKSFSYPLKIVYYDDEIKTLIELIKLLHHSYEEILLLGRNNQDVKRLIDSSMFLYEGDTLFLKENKNINLTFLTVHKAKGLEKEVVIILHMEDDILGFPNKIIEKDLLKLLLPKEEQKINAEERRLFYVALTRTKNEVYCMTSFTNSSSFIKEIVRDNFKKIERLKLTNNGFESIFFKRNVI